MSYYCFTKFASMMTDTAITIVMHNISMSHPGQHYFSPNMVHQEVDRNGLKITSQTSSNYSKTCVKWPLSKRQKICFQGQLAFNAGQKYCRMLPLEHSAILSTFIKLPFVIKIFVLSIFEWPFYIGFTVVLL